MAKAKKTQKTVDTWKKKKWHRVIAPKLFNEQVLGETPALEPDALLGRTVTVSLMNLTRDMKKEGTNITFEVNRVMGDTGYTHIKAFIIKPASIKRQVKRRKDRIDDSFVCKTMDNLPVRVKPFLITRSAAKNSVGTQLRRATKDYITRIVAKTPFDVVMKDLITKRFQSTMRHELQKIYPLKTCEIRVCELELKGKKIGDVRTKIERPAETSKPAEVKKTEAPAKPVQAPKPAEVKKTEKPVEKPVQAPKATEEKKTETKPVEVKK